MMKRHFATRTITVDGRQFKAGDELVGVRDSTLVSMLRMRQARSEEHADPPAVDGAAAAMVESPKALEPVVEMAAGENIEAAPAPAVESRPAVEESPGVEESPAEHHLKRGKRR